MCQFPAEHLFVTSRIRVWRLKLCLLAGVIGPAAGYAQGTFSVNFQQPVYPIPAGGTIPINVLIDPVPGAGLFSYGISVSFNPIQAAIELTQITPPEELNFNGVRGPGAISSVGNGIASIKGTVDVSVQPLRPYMGSLLATVLVTDHSGKIGGSYTLGLSIYRTLGSSEHVFVDGSGQVLDGNIVFGTTTLNVVPEPKPLHLALFGSCCWFWVVRRPRSKAGLRASGMESGTFLRDIGKRRERRSSAALDRCIDQLFN